MTRMLVVDDDHVFAATLARSLEKRGWETLVAHELAAALELASRGSPTHAVIDLKIGQESGLNLLPALLESVPGIRIVMLTGYSSIATAVSAIRLGAINYVCKPADADDILQAFEAPQGDGAETPVPENPPSVRRLQWEHVQKVLAEHDGNISRTARSLGMHRRSLQRFLQKKPVGR